MSSLNILFLILLGLEIITGQSLHMEEKCVELCKCWYPSQDNETLLMNCSKAKITQLPNELLPVNRTLHLVASFAHNSINHLKKLPPTNTTTLTISLKNCSIETLDSGLFEDVVNIKYLDLSWNLLKSEELHAAVFQGSYNEKEYRPIDLSELDLSHNRIVSLEHRIFEHTPHLTILDLSSNPLGVLDHDTWMALVSLKQLTRLNLSNCSLSTIADQTVLGMEHLPPVRVLNLSYNNLSSVPAVLASSLEKLMLDGNPIQTLDDQSLLGLTRLRELHLSYMKKLRSVYHNTFSHLKELRSLHLHHNPKLSFIHGNAFGEQEDRPPITELHINDNNLKQLSPNLLNWSAVTTLHLEGNHWACRCDSWTACTCLEASTHTRSLPPIKKETSSGKSSVTRGILISLSIILCLGGVVFGWRILVKYRNNRAVNNMYPVLYSSIPVPHSAH